MSSIYRCHSKPNQAWDEYVMNHPESTLFHLSQWFDLLQDYFKLECIYLEAREGSTIIGVLPLARVKSVMFGDALISIPFSSNGGPLAQTQSVYQMLIEEAQNYAKKINVDYLEIREKKNILEEGIKQPLYVNFEKTIHSDNELNLSEIPRKQRAVVRKGIKLDLKTDFEGNIESFYRLYSESVRNLGTPVMSLKFFKYIKKIFGKKCQVLTISNKEQKLSSVMSFYFKDRVMPYYGGGGLNARQYHANDYMYWALLSHAANRGYKVFDFGRSKVDSGSYRFKKHWGFIPEEMNYRYFLVNRTTAPEVNPNNPKYKLMIDIWKKLPLPITQQIGPYIARKIG